ncbi:MAG: J domain-containing protein [Deinococcota bacterium]
MSLVSRLHKLLRAEVAGRLKLPGQRRSSTTDATSGYSDSRYSDSRYSDTGHTNQQDTQDTYRAPRATHDAKIASYYAALELPYGADMNAVKQAHRRLIKQYHPDRFYFYDDTSKQPTASEVTRRLNEAYQGLCDYLEAS